MVEQLKRLALVGLVSILAACAAEETGHPPEAKAKATTSTVAAREGLGIPTPPTSPPAVTRPSPTTTTTVPPPTTTAAPPAVPSGAKEVSSTNYCLRGTMANGRPVHDGAVAVNSADWADLQGTSWTVVDGQFAGRTFTVEDHGPGADFDIWVPSCAAAEAYGRRRIHVVPA